MFLTLSKGVAKQSASLLLWKSLHQCLSAVVATERMLIRLNKILMFRAADVFSVLFLHFHFSLWMYFNFPSTSGFKLFFSSTAYGESSLLVLHAGAGFLSFFASSDLSGHQKEGEPLHSFFVMFITHCQSVIESLQQAMISWTVMKDTHRVPLP